MKKYRKFLLGVTSIALSLSLAGCGSKDSTVRTANDGNEKKVEEAAVKLVKATESGKYKLISVDDVKKAVDNKEDVLLVNTMPAENFAATKIGDSVNAGLPVSMDKLKPEEKEAFLKVLGDNKDKKIIVYCGFVACGRSDVGAKLAVEAGYKNVYRFPGGIAAWLDNGGSVAK